MIRFLKNFFLPKQSLKKKRFFLISFLAFLIFFLFYRYSPAQAFTWTWLPEKIAQAILGLALTALLNFAQGILNLGIIFFNWSFQGLNVSYTNPAENEIIRIGWTLIRDFTNIFFILGLVYIGLATALRIAGFQTKKVFATFILVALFVNFTPIICGLIVDFSNLLMNFFLGSPGGWEVLNSIFDQQRAVLIPHIIGEPNWTLFGQIALLAGFGIISGLILLLYGLLFFVRHPVLWVITIVSPLAFFAYIFPQSKKWFLAWWNQLLQWSFIGAIAGFFIYLSRHTLFLAQQPAGLTVGGTPDSAFNELAPYIVAGVFMIFGFIASLQTSAMGANFVISSAGKVGKGVAKGTAKFGGKATKLAGAAALGGARGAVEGTAEGKGAKGRVAGFFKGGLKGALTPEGQEKGREVVGRFLEKAHLVRPGFYEKDRKKRLKIDELTSQYEKLPTNRLNEIMQRASLRPADVAAKAAATETLGKRHEFKLEKPEQEKTAIRRAQAFGADLSELIKGRPDLAPIVKSAKVVKLRKEQRISQEEAETQTIKETIEAMSPREFTRNVQPAAIKAETFAWFSPQQISYLGQRGTFEQRLESAKVSISKSLHSYVAKLLERGETEAAKKIHDKYLQIAHDPNYQIL